MNVLHLYSGDERDDLVEWMQAHADEEDWPKDTLAVAQWLSGLAPGEHPVAEPMVEALLHAIDDWGEVMDYQDEDFETWVEVPDGQAV